MPSAAWMLGGRYRVAERIGTGGMAEVFRAHDELLGRDVAVKVFRTLVDTDASHGGPARQELELQALARLNHPNLITLFDASVSGSDGPEFLVTELVEGPSLAGRLADGPVPESDVREVGRQIAGALDYVHAHDMVHRDVKPANILLGAEPGGGLRARLSDFGIVRMLGSERMTSAELTLGTACYLAPEQARGAEIGPAADIYALGLVLLEALTGVRSYDGPPVEAALARLSRPPDIPPDLPQPWPALLLAMTAGDPSARPSAAEVEQALRTGEMSSTTAGLDSFEPDTAELPFRRRHAGVLAAALAMLAALGGAAYLVARTPSDRHTDHPAVVTTGPVRSTAGGTRSTGPGVVSGVGAVQTTSAATHPPTSRTNTPSSAATTSTAPASSTPPPSSPSASPTTPTTPTPTETITSLTVSPLPTGPPTTAAD